MLFDLNQYSRRDFISEIKPLVSLALPPPLFYFLDNLTQINAGLALQWRDYVAPLLRAA